MSKFTDIKSLLPLLVASLMLGGAIILGPWFWQYILQMFDKLTTPQAGFILAFLAGAVSFFSPCALPLLPAYVSYYLGLERKTKGVREPILLGAAGASGILMFYTVVGFVVALAGISASPYLSAFKPLFGAILVVFGISLMFGYSFNAVANQLWHRLDSGKENRAPMTNFFLFGLGYGATAAGCTLPIFAAFVVYPLISGDVVGGTLAFALYASAKAMLLIIVTMLVASSRDIAVRKMMLSAGAIKKFSGGAMIIVGLYLLYYSGMA